MYFNAILTLHDGTYFGEVADDVRSLFVDLRENVKDERLHVKIQRLMVKKQLR